MLNLLKTISTTRRTRPAPDLGYLFDSEWYISTYKDIRNAGAQPQTHFQHFGWRERRNPGPYFWTGFYLDQQIEVQNLRVSPLDHYYKVGWLEGRDPNPIFDTKWYKAKYLGGTTVKVDAFRHYLTRGAYEGYWPHPLFDPHWYADHTNLPANTLSPMRHFLAQGNRATDSPNEFFDCTFYASRYIDISRTDIHPITHFMTNGAKRGLLPSLEFDTASYIKDNPDVAASSLNPLEHYLHYGRHEKRSTLRKPVSIGDPDARSLLVDSLKRNLALFLAGSNIIIFAAPVRPRVTIILVLFNKSYFTLSCLQHIYWAASAHSGTELEIIIYDNASTDETIELLGRLRGVRIIGGSENIGYLRAVNQCLQLAKGEFVLLLNSDTFILPSSIEAAYSVFLQEPAAGVVGGRLILPNNKLQEAGSIIWSDASCLGYQRDADPEHSSVMYRRDVDYVSGAFLMIRKDLVDRIGGFDEKLAPAYYEESDLCMRAWERHARVVFDPGVAAVHFEFGSASSQHAAAEQMRRNQPYIRAKHATYLLRKYPAALSKLYFACDARSGLLRVLFIDDRVPYPWLGSGFPRSESFVRSVFDAIGDQGVVTLLTTDEHIKDWHQIRTAIPARIEVAFAAPLGEFHRFLIERISQYDIIIVSRPHNMKRLRDFLEVRIEVDPPRCLIYDAEALFSRREVLHRQFAGEALTREEISGLLDEEITLADRADIVTTVSEDEASEFKRRISARVEVLGHSLAPTPTPSSFMSRHGLLFVGGLVGHDTPNVDSILWFFSEIWEKIRSINQEIVLFVAGVLDSDRVVDRCPDGVKFLGKVDNLSEWYDRTRVFIAPTRYAAGIPHKVHEAASRGLPSVVTPILAQQLGWKDGEEVVVGATSGQFAAACLSLHDDEDRWRHVREASLRAVGDDCNPGTFDRKVRSIISHSRQVALGKNSGPSTPELEPSYAGAVPRARALTRRRDGHA